MGNEYRIAPEMNAVAPIVIHLRPFHMTATQLDHLPTDILLFLCTYIRPEDCFSLIQVMRDFQLSLQLGGTKQPIIDMQVST
jgi:hypothetical protein